MRRVVFSCGLDKTSLSQLVPMINEQNLRNMRWTSWFLGAAALLFLAVSLLTSVGMPELYLFELVGCLTVILARKAGAWQHTLGVLVLGYALIGIALAYGIALSFIDANRANPSASFLALLVLMPLTFLDVAWRMYAFTGVYAGAFVALSTLYKPSAASVTDCINVLTFYVLGMALYTVLTCRQVREMHERQLAQDARRHLIASFSTVVESRDEETVGHVGRCVASVTGLVERVRKMPAYQDRSDEYWENVLDSVPLHDIGKLRVPRSILNKPANLTAAEHDEIMMHPVWGAEAIDEAFQGEDEQAFRLVARNVALYHHERWDGGGYPVGLVGEEIPLEARIMAIADVYDAVVSQRSYKPALAAEEGRFIIASGAGTHFDPVLSNCFIDYLDERGAEGASEGLLSWGGAHASAAAVALSDGRVLKDDEPMRFVPRIRTVAVVMVLTGAIFAAVGIAALVSLLSARTTTSVARDRHEECVMAATELMSASDYLTTQARMYVMTGDEVYLHAYVTEIEETRRRDHAAETFKSYEESTEATIELARALKYSNELAEREYYAMRLRAEALGQTDLPEELASVELTDVDAALDADRKAALAQEMVFGTEYDVMKARIVQGVNNCSRTLEEELWAVREASYANEVRLQRILMMMLVADAILLAAEGLAYYFLVMRPLESHDVSIQDNLPLAVIGSREVRNVALSYNRLYEENRRRTMMLRRQARTDALTGALNRGSFDHVLSTHGEDVALLIVDVDLFKSINDNYGHEVGDQVLKKVANTLRTHFRTSDFVCRIGGDEFAVVLTDMPSELRDVVSGKLDAIESDLADTSDGLPRASVSVGVAFSVGVPAPMKLYNAADLALYEAKRRGRAGYAFFDGATMGE